MTTRSVHDRGLLKGALPRALQIDASSASANCSDPRAGAPADFGLAGTNARSEQALHDRRPIDGELVHHSDHGVQYVSITHTERLAEAGIEPSVGSVGDSFDDALAETVIGLFKAEVIRRPGPWRSLEAVEWATLACEPYRVSRRPRFFGRMGPMTTNRTAKPYPAELRERVVRLVRRFKSEHVGHYRRCRAYQQCFKAQPAPRGAALLLGALPGARRQAAAGDETAPGRVAGYYLAATGNPAGKRPAPGADTPGARPDHSVRDPRHGCDSICTSGQARQSPALHAPRRRGAGGAAMTGRRLPR